MQLHITFSTDMLNLPIAYNAIVQGFIYHTLAAADPVFSDIIHNKGRDRNIDLPKNFTFGRLAGDYRTVGRQTIVFPRSAALEIRSTDKGFIQKLLLGCCPGETVRLGTNAVKIKEMTVEDKKITESKINAFCLSPITFHAAYPDCLSFDAGTAARKITDNALKKWQCAGFDGSGFDFGIEFPDAQPKRIDTVFKTISVTAWETPFVLSGNPETLTFLYNTGIGSRNSQGFGVFEKIS